MYKLQMRYPTTINMTGMRADPSLHPVTLAKGWNPVGFVSLEPMSMADAFTSLNAVSGDIVKTQTRFAWYLDGFGWCGSLAQDVINPGDGLMFKSVTDENRTFTYASQPYGSLVINDSEGCHWNANAHAYSSNMTVLAVAMLNGQEVRTTDYELAAFSDDECRGSVRIMYVEPLQKHIAFLTIAGDNACTLRFALYNTVTGRVIDRCDDYLTYSADGVVGSPEEPLVLHFIWNIGVDETSANARVYPNPTDGVFTVEAQGMTRITVMNALGQMVYDALVEGDETSLDLAHYGAGIYMIRINTATETFMKKISVTK